MSTIGSERHPDSTIRRSIRLVSMLAELHKAGYQRLRAMPAMSPSGMHWRYTIAPVSAFHSNHGAVLAQEALEVLAPGVESPSPDAAVAYWTSGSGSDGHHFGWSDAARDDARALAIKFLERFPRLAALGRGWDYAYAGWHLRVLGLAERGWLPIAFDDAKGPSARGIALIDTRPPAWRDRDNTHRPHLPLPPPGDWPDEVRLSDGEV